MNKFKNFVVLQAQDFDIQVHLKQKVFNSVSVELNMFYRIFPLLSICFFKLHC
jgi:hypothetical protein